MFYKVIFNEPIEYDELEKINDSEGNPVFTQTNNFTGLDSVLYSNSQIDLLMNCEGRIDGLQICNECTKTFNIENHLLSITQQVIVNSGITAELFDGSGFSEIVDSGNIEEYLN